MTILWFSETTLHSCAPNSTESRNNILWKISSVVLPTLLGTSSLENNKMDNHSWDYRVQIKHITQEGGVAEFSHMVPAP